MLEIKFILLAFVYFRSKFNATGVISCSFAVIREFCRRIADFLSLLFWFLMFGGVALRTGWVQTCWLKFWLREIEECYLTILFRGFSILEIDLDKLLLETDRLLGFGLTIDFWSFFTLIFYSSLNFNLLIVKLLINDYNFYDSTPAILWTKSSLFIRLSFAFYNYVSKMLNRAITNSWGIPSSL